VIEVDRASAAMSGDRIVLTGASGMLGRAILPGVEVRRLNLECDHFNVVEEILVKLSDSRPNFRIKEVPFTFEKRKAGETKRHLATFILGYLGTLVRLWRLKVKAKREAKRST
jgi:hypothetical protein